MFLRQVFDPYLAQYAYLVGCQRSGEALLIDPERDIDRYRELAAGNDLRIAAVAETHIHADFVSGAQEFAADPDIDLYLSALGGPDWTYRWPGNRPKTHLLKDGDTFRVGGIQVDVIHTPGHTPEHISFLMTDRGSGAGEPIALATGDFLFVGDVGRPDLLESAAGVKGAMEPAARVLQVSLESRLKVYGDYLQILPAHGAGSACGKALGAVPTTTLGYERRFNPALKLAASDGAAFIKEILSGQPKPPPYFATMKRVNKLGIQVTGGVPRPGRIDAAALAARANDMSVRILDARDDRTVFDAGHFPGSIYAPLHSAFFLTSAGSYLNELDPILLVVEKPEDVDLAARQLYRIGFDHLEGWATSRELRQQGSLSATMERIEFKDFDPSQARSDGVILDVRTSAEFARGHLEKAQSIPYTRLRARLNEVPRGKKLFIHCGSGKRAALAGSFLQSVGYPVVHIDGICHDCQRIAVAEGVAH